MQKRIFQIRLIVPEDQHDQTNINNFFIFIILLIYYWYL